MLSDLPYMCMNKHNLYLFPHDIDNGVFPLNILCYEIIGRMGGGEYR